VTTTARTQPAAAAEQRLLLRAARIIPTTPDIGESHV
jgi:hypothetical protein